MRSNAHRVVQNELDRGERLLWSGQPKQGLRLTPADVFLIPFSLMWGGFAIFWEVSVIVMGAPVFMALFGVPFVAIGLYFIFGRFFYDAKQRERTFYGVTDTRVLIVSGVFSRSIRSLELATLPQLTPIEKSDRSGNLLLGPPGPFPTWMADVGWPGMSANQYLPPAFNQIERVREVHDLIRDAQREVVKP